LEGAIFQKAVRVAYISSVATDCEVQCEPWVEDLPCELVGKKHTNAKIRFWSRGHCRRGVNLVKRRDVMLVWYVMCQVLLCYVHLPYSWVDRA